MSQTPAQEADSIHIVYWKTVLCKSIVFQIKCKISQKTVTKTFSTRKSVTKTIKGLKKGTYKVQVRSFVKKNSKKVYGKWTNAKTVKVKL